MTETIRMLVVVKTYPTLSREYTELVCTAGFREDGSWIRIYPIPFRFLQGTQQYHKWQWIKVKVVKNRKDFRLESYRPYDLDGSIELQEVIGTNENWARRIDILKQQKIWTNMSDIIREAKEKHISLAILKPKKIVDFVWEPVEKEWDKEKLDFVLANLQQGTLFDDDCKRSMFKIAKKLPYKFSYKFITDDDVERTLMIEDWELGMLYWNALKKANGNEAIACQKVKDKYFRTMTDNRDLHFFLGTTLKFQARNAPNPFIIIGTFWPPVTNAHQLQIPFAE